LIKFLSKEAIDHLVRLRDAAEKYSCNTATDENENLLFRSCGVINNREAVGVASGITLALSAASKPKIYMVRVSPHNEDYITSRFATDEDEIKQIISDYIKEFSGEKAEVSVNLAAKTAEAKYNDSTAFFYILMIEG
jgi:hypothetical protein